MSRTTRPEAKGHRPKEFVLRVLAAISGAEAWLSALLCVTLMVAVLRSDAR